MTVCFTYNIKPCGQYLKSDFIALEIIKHRFRSVTLVKLRTCSLHVPEYSGCHRSIFRQSAAIPYVHTAYYRYYRQYNIISIISSCEKVRSRSEAACVDIHWLDVPERVKFKH